jgi:hypothetical protein
MRVAAAVLLILGLLSLAIPRERFGDQPRYRIPADQALADANSYVRSLGIDPGAFRHVTYAEDRWDQEERLAARYFAARLPLAASSRLFDKNRPLHIWATRYFKPLDQEEVLAAIHPETGQPLGFHHTIPENRPGADLSSEAARQLAADFAARQGWSTAGMILKVNSSEKQKARTDHSLEWEAPPGDPRNVGDAHFRIAMSVDGDQVTSLRSHWDIPEAYQRFREGGTLATHALTALKIVVISGILVWGLGILLRNVRRGLVPWRLVLRIAALTTTAMAIGELLSLRLIFKQYPTTIPLVTFEATAAIGIGVSVIFGFLALAAAVALLASCYPASLQIFERKARRILGFDALAALAAVSGIVLLWRTLEALLGARFHALDALSVSTPSLIDSSSPLVAALARAVESVPAMAAAGAAAVLVAKRLKRPWLMFLLGLLVAAAMMPGDVRTPAEFAFGYGGAVLAVALPVAACLLFARDNYLAYALILWTASLWESIADLFANPMRPLQVQGGIVGAVLVLSLIWAAAPGFQREREPQKQTATYP